MKRYYIWPAFIVMAAMVTAQGRLCAQTALCINNKGKLELVGKATAKTAFVEENGQWVAIPDGAFLLKPANEYIPILVTIKNLNFHKGERGISDNGTSTSHLVHAGRFVYTADFEADSDLENVVLVLELNSAQIGDYVYLHELGDLKAHHSVHLSIDEITQFRLFGVQLRGTHLFVNGRELFTSELPGEKRKEALDAMVAKRIAAGKDGPITPLAAYDAIYPPSLKSGPKGEATVTVRVDVNGNPGEARVAHASDPAFGEAAVQAITHWRFVPEIRGGAIMEAKANVPFAFAPP